MTLRIPCIAITAIAGTALLIGVFLLLSTKTNELSTEATRTNEPRAKSSPKNVYKFDFARQVFESREEVLPARSNFDSPEGFEQLRKQVLSSGSFLLIEKRREDFQQSGLDTKENADAAKLTVLMKYPDTIDEMTAIKRVVALHFLRYSRSLKSDDCLNMLNNLISQHESASLDAHRRAVKFDMGAVAYMCAPIGTDAFFHEIESLQVPSLKAQCKNALSVYAEDEARGTGL